MKVTLATQFLCSPAVRHFVVSCAGEVLAANTNVLCKARQQQAFPALVSNLIYHFVPQRARA